MGSVEKPVKQVQEKSDLPYTRSRKVRVGANEMAQQLKWLAMLAWQSEFYS